MKRKCLYITSMLILTVGYSISGQSVKPDKIEDLKVQLYELLDDFELFQERIAKPGDSTNEQIIQFWRKDAQEQNLELIEDIKHSSTDSAGACTFQKWYRENNNGNRDKIEIGIIICESIIDMEKTIVYFTKEAYADPFSITKTPLVGDKSWISRNMHFSQNSHSLMFSKLNVFVRVFVRVKEYNADEIQRITERIAAFIETKIELSKS